MDISDDEDEEMDDVQIHGQEQEMEDVDGRLVTDAAKGTVASDRAVVSEVTQGKGEEDGDGDEDKDEGVEITHTSHARDGAASSLSDDSESGYRCCVCGRRDDSGILVCLKCGKAAHSACYFRPGSVDEGDSISRGDTWLCASCGGPPQAVMATGLAAQGAQDGHVSGRSTQGEDDVGGDAKRIQVTGEVVGERHKRVRDTVCL